MDKIKPIEIYPRPGCCGAYPPAPPVKYVDYNTMVSNKPMINGHILEGNKTAKELGIDGNGDMSDYYTKQEVNALIPDMRNYYTKQQVDAKIPDMTNYYTKAQTDSRIADKQDTLVSGSNIKTVNNISLLGSGNIDVGSDNIFPVIVNQTDIADLTEAFYSGKFCVFVDGTGNCVYGYIPAIMPLIALSI